MLVIADWITFTQEGLTPRTPNAEGSEVQVTDLGSSDTTKGMHRLEAGLISDYYHSQGELCVIPGPSPILKYMCT